MIVEDFEAPERNGTDYGDEDVMIIDEIPDIPDLPEAGNEVLEEDVVTVQNKENKEPHPTKEYIVAEKTKESDENAKGIQNNTKGDQDKDKISNR